MFNYTRTDDVWWVFFFLAHKHNAVYILFILRVAFFGVLLRFLLPLFEGVSAENQS